MDLLTARFGVRRAELEVKRNELLSAIDAKKNVLSLEEAKRRLQQLESDIKSRQEQAQAEIAVLRENKNKGLLELHREKARLSAGEAAGAHDAGWSRSSRTGPTSFSPACRFPIFAKAIS